MHGVILHPGNEDTRILLERFSCSAGLVYRNRPPVRGNPANPRSLFIIPSSAPSGWVDGIFPITRTTSFLSVQTAILMNNRPSRHAEKRRVGSVHYLGSESGICLQAAFQLPLLTPNPDISALYLYKKFFFSHAFP